MSISKNGKDTVYSILFDLHSHSISSGHGTTDTVSDLIRSACEKNLSLLGISDHGPATKGSASPSYFRGLKYAEKLRFGIQVLYGVELNIVDLEGKVDLEDSILQGLDYAFISIHPPLFTPYQHKDLTEVYKKAMNHPNVRFLGHIDDDRFPVNFENLLLYAKERSVYPEINNSSLMPKAYRVGGQQNCRTILKICKEIHLPVLLSSDSHGKEKIGNMEYIYPLLEELSFPQNLILNSNMELLQKILY